MDFRQRKEIENEQRKKLLKHNPYLSENSGVYTLTRVEDGIRYAYIGQAKHILERLVGHMMGTKQEIDWSLKKRGLYSADNLEGWNISYLECEEEQLDAMEKHWIINLANKGYQLYNKTYGGQGVGKNALGEATSPKRYRTGVEVGALREKKKIKEFFDKYLDFSIKQPVNKVKQRKFEEFKDYLEVLNEED